MVVDMSSCIAAIISYCLFFSILSKKKSKHSWLLHLLYVFAASIYNNLKMAVPIRIE